MLKAIFAIAVLSLLFFSTGHFSSGPEPEISPELKKIADCAYLNNSEIGEACALHEVNIGFFENQTKVAIHDTGWYVQPDGSFSQQQGNAELIDCPCSGKFLRYNSTNYQLGPAEPLPTTPNKIVEVTTTDAKLQRFI